MALTGSRRAHELARSPLDERLMNRVDWMSSQTSISRFQGLYIPMPVLDTSATPCSLDIMRFAPPKPF